MARSTMSICAVHMPHLLPYALLCVCESKLAPTASCQGSKKCELHQRRLPLTHPSFCADRYETHVEMFLGGIRCQKCVIRNGRVSGRSPANGIADFMFRTLLPITGHGTVMTAGHQQHRQMIVAVTHTTHNPFAACSKFYHVSHKCIARI